MLCKINNDHCINYYLSKPKMYFKHNIHKNYKKLLKSEFQKFYVEISHFHYHYIEKYVNIISFLKNILKAEFESI